MPNRFIVLIALTLLLASTHPPTTVAAQESVDEFTVRITDELRSRNSAAAELFAEANLARDAEDWQTAEQLYRRVRELEPDFLHATRRLCGVVLQQDRRQDALSLCREVYDREASRENRSALVVALAARDESGKQPTEAELEEALEHASILLDDPDVDEWAVVSACQAAAASSNTATLSRCYGRLQDVSPDHDLTHYVGWLLPMLRGDLALAESRLEKARAAGMSPELYAQLAEATRDARPMMPGFVTGLPGLVRTAGIVGGVWLGLLVLLLGTGAILSQLTLRNASRLPSVQSGESVGIDAALRKLYRIVLWLCSAYYYVSIPLVLLAVVGLGGGILYAFFAAGRIPIRLLIIVVIVVFVTLWAAIKSIFVRVRDEDPGEKLDVSEHPRLRGVLDEVAEQIDTRPVDNVYMTPGTDLAVMERGGVMKQLRGGTERCLILGVGVLDGMKVGPFKAILAHEYGHFSNRDTAGGGFALAVRRSLLTMAQALAEGGAAAWYNPAWLFLNGFYRVFLRISQGASRLQEILADRWAAFAYGAKQFECGLRHVIERSIRFDAHVNMTLQEVIDGNRALVNLYRYQTADVPDENAVVEALTAAIDAAPSPYDSHPAPRSRFEWVHALQAEPVGNLADADLDVWDLFANRGEVELRMTDYLRASVKANHGIALAGASS